MLVGADEEHDVAAGRDDTGNDGKDTAVGNVVRGVAHDEREDGRDSVGRNRHELDAGTFVAETTDNRGRAEWSES